MTWLDGIGLRSLAGRGPARRSATRSPTRLFRAWYVPFYRYGVIHGDPHLGNYQVRAGRRR